MMTRPPFLAALVLASIVSPLRSETISRAEFAGRFSSARPPTRAELAGVWRLALQGAVHSLDGSEVQNWLLSFDIEGENPEVRFGVGPRRVRETALGIEFDVDSDASMLCRLDGEMLLCRLRPVRKEAPIGSESVRGFIRAPRRQDGSQDLPGDWLALRYGRGFSSSDAPDPLGRSCRLDGWMLLCPDGGGAFSGFYRE